MAHPIRSDSYSSADGSTPPAKPYFVIQKVIGIALMLVGSVFSLYCGTSGIAKLISITGDHFGMLCVAGVINFIFWTLVAVPIFPFGGFAANAICIGGGVLLFAGLPAVPGAVVAFGGFLLFVNA